MSMPRAVRHINERRVLDSLLRKGPMTRAELARDLSLTRATAGNLVSGLTRAQLVMEGTAADRETRDTRPGHPGSLVELNGSYASFLGAEIAVGRIRLIEMNLCGEILYRGERAFDPAHSSPSRIINLLTAAIARIPKPSVLPQVRQLGVAVAGLVSAGGTVLRAPFLEWHDVELVQMLTARLPEFSTIVAENDANAFAGAELWQASCDPPADAVYLLLDVGVGGGMVSNGALVRGRHGSAGEIGHMPLSEPAKKTRSILPGSLESFVGIEALLEDFREHRGKADHFESFAEQVKQQNPIAKQTLKRWAGNLGRGLAILSAVLDPDRFVFGGPASVLVDECKPAIERALRSHLMETQKLPALMVSHLGADAPAIGAALTLQRKFLAFDTDLIFNGSSGPQPEAGKTES